MKAKAEAVSNFERLRRLGRLNESEAEFEALALRYRRLGRDYASVAREALSTGALWDGGGAGVVEAFWKKIVELEYRREGVRVGTLGQMLDMVNAPDDDPEQMAEQVVEFVNLHTLSPEAGKAALMAELLRRHTVRGVTVLKREAYGIDGGPYKAESWDEEASIKAQEALRFADSVDRR